MFFHLGWACLFLNNKKQFYYGMVTYQVSLEVDEDSGCHLGDEDEEETGEVLQTEDRKVHLQLLDTQTKARTF